MSSRRRLEQLLAAFAPTDGVRSVGTLKLGDIAFPVCAAATPSRLPHLQPLLFNPGEDKGVASDLYFLLQKYVLGQDVFLSSQPGPYARRLAMTFCSLINSEYEYVALHRDVGETELKQGREIREGGTLAYVDSAAVRAVKYGRILILEGIEKAERGIMPLLNNLLENREMNLDDGTHIIHPHRHALLDNHTSSNTFILAHKNFRVIAIGAPVPPYPGYPLDPPFRSRFQARHIDPINAMISLSKAHPSFHTPAAPLVVSLRRVIIATQYASEARADSAFHAIGGAALPPFPQTALSTLIALCAIFPPPEQLSPTQLTRLLRALHPALLHASAQAWTTLSEHTQGVGLGALGDPSADDDVHDGVGLLGYRATRVDRVDNTTAKVWFSLRNSASIAVLMRAGPHTLAPFPYTGADPSFHPSPRFDALLTSLLQAHALGMDLSLLPPVAPSASCSSTLLLRALQDTLGYSVRTLHIYKELGGRELLLRRHIKEGGATAWEPSTVVTGAWNGEVVHLSGLDAIGPTAGSLARLAQDREVELDEGRRIVKELFKNEVVSELSTAHPSFRLVVTASKATPLHDWVGAEHASMFFTLPLMPMRVSEENELLRAAGASSVVAETLVRFAGVYRKSLAEEPTPRRRRLGTRALVRIARRMAATATTTSSIAGADLHALLSRAVLAEFLPATERMNLESLFEDCDIVPQATPFHPPPEVQGRVLVFSAPTSATAKQNMLVPVSIPLFDASLDPEGAKYHVPYMESFYDNSLQSGLMRDLAVDLEVLGEHLVLLGNQGVGKNKVIDRLCQLLGRPREYIQLHRDSTVHQIVHQTSVEGGVIRHLDSPLLRAIERGRICVVDEADKAPEHVVAVFKSLAGQGEMSLPDGRRVVPVYEREGDVVVHPRFRLVLLANRPGYPFLGNHFLQVLGDVFSCHSVSNPDIHSERRLLSQMAPELSEDMLLRLVAAFQDLRRLYDDGTLTYPYSLRELINIVKHISTYPSDTIDNALRNTFDFDMYRPDALEKLEEVLVHHRLIVPGSLDPQTARDATQKQSLDIDFEAGGSPPGAKEPKFGEEDPEGGSHEGGNQFSGGSGGSETAGQGGRGGYMRLSRGHEIHQLSDTQKADVSEEVQEEARELARRELERRLKELDMSEAHAEKYGHLLNAVQGHIAALHDLFENLETKEEERVWIKRQTDGEFDDSRLTEGITGEANVYKRRGMEKPESGRPQIKPKRIRFVFDVSGSMYRFQYDGRLRRSSETAVMLMETFSRITRPDKYVWDMYGHSGESPTIPLVEAEQPISSVRERWKTVEKIEMITQYAFGGDYTLDAIEKAVDEVARFDADDWFVIALSDANFGRYGITVDDLGRALNRNTKVHTALICFGDGVEATWIPKKLPGRAFRVTNTADIPKVLRSILSTMVDR